MSRFPLSFPPKLNIPAIHSLDITNWDLSRLDPRKLVDGVDLGSAIAESPVARLAGRSVGQARDVALTAVGFGVLATQKIQVRRRELFDAITQWRAGTPDAAPPAADVVASDAPAASTDSL